MAAWRLAVPSGRSAQRSSTRAPRPTRASTSPIVTPAASRPAIRLSVARASTRWLATCRSRASTGRRIPASACRYPDRPRHRRRRSVLRRQLPDPAYVPRLFRLPLLVPRFLSSKRAPAARPGFLFGGERHVVRVGRGAFCSVAGSFVAQQTFSSASRSRCICRSCSSAPSVASSSARARHRPDGRCCSGSTCRHAAPSPRPRGADTRDAARSSAASRRGSRRNSRRRPPARAAG